MKKTSAGSIIAAITSAAAFIGITVTIIQERKIQDKTNKLLNKIGSIGPIGDFESWMLTVSENTDLKHQVAELTALNKMLQEEKPKA